MIDAQSLDRYPEVPESEVEWEDLLYRLELMLKGLPITLERSPGGDHTARILEDLIRREAEVAAFLEDACLDERDGARATALEPTEFFDVQRMTDEFRRLRARVFAIVQRRGIEVWSWKGTLPGGGRATIYRVLRYLQQADTRSLAAIREPEATATC